MTNSTEKAADAVAQCKTGTRAETTLRSVSGAGAADVIDSLRHTAPDLARYVIEFAYGDIYSQPALTPPDRQLVTLGAASLHGARYQCPAAGRCR